MTQKKFQKPTEARRNKVTGIKHKHGGMALKRLLSSFNQGPKSLPPSVGPTTTGTRGLTIRRNDDNDDAVQDTKRARVDAAGSYVPSPIEQALLPLLSNQLDQNVLGSRKRRQFSMGVEAGWGFTAPIPGLLPGAMQAPAPRDLMSVTGPDGSTAAHTPNDLLSDLGKMSAYGPVQRFSSTQEQEATVADNHWHYEIKRVVLPPPVPSLQQESLYGRFRHTYVCKGGSVLFRKQIGVHSCESTLNKTLGNALYHGVDRGIYLALHAANELLAQFALNAADSDPKKRTTNPYQRLSDVDHDFSFDGFAAPEQDKRDIHGDIFDRPAPKATALSVFRRGIREVDNIWTAFPESFVAGTYLAVRLIKKPLPFAPEVYCWQFEPYATRDVRKLCRTYAAVCRPAPTPAQVAWSQLTPTGQKGRLSPLPESPFLGNVIVVGTVSAAYMTSSPLSRSELATVFVPDPRQEGKAHDTYIRQAQRFPRVRINVGGPVDMMHPSLSALPGFYPHNKHMQHHY